MVYCLLGAKPLPEPTLTYCQLEPSEWNRNQTRLIFIQQNLHICKMSTTFVQAQVVKWRFWIQFNYAAVFNWRHVFRQPSHYPNRWDSWRHMALLRNSENEPVNIWVRSRNCGCLVTWFCYQLIAKPGNKTATVLWPDPYKIHGAFWNNVHCISINSVPIVTVPWCSIDKSHTDFSSKSRSNSSPLGQNGRPVFQTMFSDAFSWMKSFVFWLKFK